MFCVFIFYSLISVQSYPTHHHKKEKKTHKTKYAYKTHITILKKPADDSKLDIGTSRCDVK